MREPNPIDLRDAVEDPLTTAPMVRVSIIDDLLRRGWPVQAIAAELPTVSPELIAARARAAA